MLWLMISNWFSFRIDSMLYMFRISLLFVKKKDIYIYIYIYIL